MHCGDQCARHCAWATAASPRSSICAVGATLRLIVVTSCLMRTARKHAFNRPYIISPLKFSAKAWEEAAVLAKERGGALGVKLSDTAVQHSHTPRFPQRPFEVWLQAEISSDVTWNVTEIFIIRFARPHELEPNKELS